MPLVLKDVWIDADRKSEGAILAEVYAEDGVNEQTRQQLDRYFLHVANDGNVYVGDVEDHTRDVMLKGHTLPDLHDSMSVPVGGHERAQVVSNLQAHGAVAVGEAEAEKPPRHTGKVHYRIVYKEVGKTIREVHSMSEVFNHLSGVARGE